MKRPAGSLPYALPWLIACLHASTWADPMRPLVLPAAASSPAAAPPALALERGARAKEGEAAREPARLAALRQDSGSRWLALFGERWVKAGDKLDNYTVGAIDGNAVQLTDGRQRRTVHLLPPLLPSDAAQTKTAALTPFRANGLPTP